MKTVLKGLAGIGGLLFLVPWFSVQVLPASWAFIFGAWAVFLGWLALRKPRRKTSAWVFNLAFLCLVLAAAEVYFEVRPVSQAAPRRGAQDGFVRPHTDLGYAPVAGVRRTIPLWWGTERISEATYTIDEHGCREGRPAAPGASLALFFGGSFMYGRGLEDHETLPNRVAELSGDRIAARNFAFGGWGAHQMLAMLESGRVEETLDRAPAHVVYLAIDDHARRAAGRAPWDRKGPCYRLEADGSVRRDGQFRPEGGAVGRRLGKWLGASHLYRLVFRRSIDPEARTLLAAVVRAAEARVRARWPACRFHVILWDHRPGVSDRTAEAFDQAGVRYLRVSEMLPGFPAELARFVLHEHDAHPNAEAMRAIATWTVRALLPPEAEEGP